MLSDIFGTDIKLLELKNQAAKKWYEKSYITPINEDFAEGLIYCAYIDNMIEFDFSVKSIDNLFKSFYNSFISKHLMRRINFATGLNYTRPEAIETISKTINTVRSSFNCSYSTNYGIGVWVMCMPSQWINETKKAIETKLKSNKMKLSQLEKASPYHVQKWLEDNLELTPNQKRIMIERELIRFSPFEFYEWPKKEKVNILWRLTILFFPIYILIIILFNPIKWMLTGKWGYSQNFFDNFHAKWTRKLGI